MIKVERKRHIGNDIVNIIFMDHSEELPNDESLIFDPNCIKSQFTRKSLFKTEK